MTSLARTAHPFTTGTVALAFTALAIVVPAPAGTIVLYAIICLVAILTGAGRGVILGLVVVAPLWFLLFLMHGVLGDSPRVPAPWGGTLSHAGVALAAVQGSRLAAIVTASLAFASVFDPNRFMQAAIAHRWRFDLAYVVVATLDAAEQLTVHARRLREAQRTRGLRVRGSLAVRIRAVPALILPLILASLTDADDRTLALESRGMTIKGPRTAFDPPPDTRLDRAIRWGALLSVVAAMVWRVAR